MRAGKGWGELGQAFYNKKLWDDRGQAIKAPTVKAVAMTGVGIAATLATGGAGAGLMGALGAAAITTVADGVFTLADIAHGADAGEAMAGWAIRGVSSFATAYIGSSGMFKADGLVGGALSSVLGKSGLAFDIGSTLAQAVTTNTVNGAINAVHYSKDGGWGYDTNVIAQSVYGAGAMAGYLGSATSVIGSSMGASWGASLQESTGWNSKLTGSIGNLAGMAAGQSMSYGASMLATGIMDGGWNSDSWGRSLDNMGGLNVNLASAGMLLDMVGRAITMGSGNSYNPESLAGLYSAAGKLSGTGLFEMSFTSEGMTGSFGGGGVQLGGAVWDVAKHGYGQMNIEAQSATMTQSDAKQRLTDLYSYGDFAAEGLINRLGAGIDELAYADQGGAGKAQTTTTANGRLITLDSSMQNQLGVMGSVVLSHEAWRNGSDDGVAGQRKETNDAVMAHIAMADILSGKYGDSGLTQTVRAEVEALRSNDRERLASLVDSYDSTADYWKLKKNGDIAFDGKTDLYDENGILIRDLRATKIESSLLELLGLKDTPENRKAMVAMMEASGLEMDTKGQWVGESTSVRRAAEFGGSTGAFYVKKGVNLTEENSKDAISLSSISQLFDSLNVDKATYQGFVENNYGSAMGFLSYAGNQLGSRDVKDLYAGAYNPDEQKMISTNIAFLQSVERDGIDYTKVVPGAKQSTAFEEAVFEALASSSVEGAKYFQEQHTGFDFGGGGSSVNTPGGIWQVTDKTKDKLFMQLFGTDVRMRVQHLNPDEVSKIALKTLIGQADNNAKIIDYPTKSYGSGSGAHTHIDFTRNLPGTNSYQRVFVNPSTWNQGSRLDYSYTYFDSNKIALPGYPKYFNRY